MLEEKLRECLTFDDVLLVPAYSDVLPPDVDIRTRLTRGLALPVPLLLTAAARRWGAAFRADVRRLNRWTFDDKRWLRTLGRDPYVRLGKFNSGQKLNAAFTAGTIPVMLATGAIMYWNKPWPVAYRTGATFVHDWVFLALAVVVTGHILIAVRDGEALNSMLRGPISRRWAQRHAPRWWEEMHTSREP